MNRKQVFRAFETRVADYRMCHPAMVEIVLAIIRSMALDKSTMQIAMEIPCSESTVYRAIKRVKEYLKIPEVESVMEMLQSYVAESPPNYGGRNV